MNKKNFTQTLLFKKQLTLFFVVILILQACGTNQSKKNLSEAQENYENKHIKVFSEDGKYGGWPANWGAWSWENEILVSFTVADHKERSGHTFDVNTAINMFARSTDGGESWKLQDAYDSGITGATFEHNLGDKSEPSTTLDEPIDFTHPDFAFTFRAHTLRDGPSSFYFSYDRGQNWEGPYALEVDFPGPEPAGIVSRTDYIVESVNEMTAFLTVGFREGNDDWRQVAAVRTTDGGQTWKHLSWIGPKKVNLIMPSSVRLDEARILTMIRRTDPPEMASYITDNNGYTWKQLNDPVKVDANGHPPAMIELQDGRLCLVYGIRHEETMGEGVGMYVVFSEDDGQTWSTPKLLRGKDGGTWDIGYPRVVQRPDGKVVAFYYYNQAGNEQMPPYRFIAATIFDPARN